MQIQNSSQRSGVALVLVLAFLALISVFVVGFFSSATSELEASSSYTASFSNKQLADTAAGIVMGQIREATTRPAMSQRTGAPGLAGRVADYDAWASQPGMIRTFRGGTDASADVTALYKLYSSDKMVITGATNTRNFASASDVPATGARAWYEKSSVFTDLNEPVYVLNPDTGLQEPRYPILDPKAFAKSNSPTAVPTVSADSVEGAWIVRDPNLDSVFEDGQDERQGRMPVRWLYVLKDGSTVAPLDEGDDDEDVATFDDEADIAPSAANPIVGRIAFWTDDDSCKVNINTAGGFALRENGTLDDGAYSFWDTPRFNTLFDKGSVDSNTGPTAAATAQKGLALSQPQTGEFQRYPGHPSTTSLGIVFSRARIPAQGGTGSQGLFPNSDALYSLTPRLMLGGSNGGLTLTRPDETIDPLRGKKDRLYATVDELLYANDSDTDFNPLVNQTQRVRKEDNGVSTGKLLTPAKLDQLRFFLTTHSRAPELNIFGRPRITIWPIWPVFGSSGRYRKLIYRESTLTDTSASRITGTQDYTPKMFQDLLTPQDRLLAFCSTIGEAKNDGGVMDDPNAKPFIFQRYDAYSSTRDAQIPRNEQLMEYLKELTSLPIPGYGGKFLNKFGETDRNVVLAQIFDYVRTVNVKDASRDTPPKFFTGSTPTQNGITRNTYKYAPRGIVVPSTHRTLNGATGQGRFSTLSEASLIFYHAGYYGYKNEPAIGTGPNAHPVHDYAHAPTDPKYYKYFYQHWEKPNHTIVGRMIAAAVVFETFNPMQGYGSVDGFDLSTEAKNRNMFMVHDASGMEDFRIRVPSFGQNAEFQSLQFPSQGVNPIWRAPINTTWVGRGVGGIDGFFYTIMQGVDPKPSSMPRPGAGYRFGTLPDRICYPFQSVPYPHTGSGESGFAPHPSWYGPGLNLSAPTPAGRPFVRPLITRQGGFGQPAGTFPMDPPTGVLVRDTEQVFEFSGGIVTFNIRWVGDDSTSDAGVVLNSYRLNFPATGGRYWPIPTDNIWNPNIERGGFPGTQAPNPSTASGGPGWNKYQEGPVNQLTGVPEFIGQYRFADRIKWAIQRSDSPWNNGRDGFTGQNADGLFYTNRWKQILQPGDTIRSLLPVNADNTSSVTRTDGDPRALALLGPNEPNSVAYFGPHPNYYDGPTVRHAQTLRAPTGDTYIRNNGISTGSVNTNEQALEPDSLQNTAGYPSGGNSGPTMFTTPLGKLIPTAGAVIPTANAPDLPGAQNARPGIDGVKSWDNKDPDFDTGIGVFPDGAYAGKADEGSFAWKYFDTNALKYFFSIPYFTNTWTGEAAFDSYFSPNRQISSAVAFGSLLAGKKKHWQTLAFSPNPMAGGSHRGLVSPPDHLLLDLFTMPVVEPYAISEPFSTAGKVNINFPIVPFDYIKRTTAMRAALHPLRVTALPVQNASNYKSGSVMANPRYPVDRDSTVAIMDAWFKGGTGGGSGERIFPVASAICEMWLVPYFASAPKVALNTTSKWTALNTTMRTWWGGYKLTGDNMREKPYSDLYARITTKSNSYTVYMRVQTLRKRPFVGTGSALENHHLRWEEGKDQVVSEYRGFTSLERYLDPQDRRLVSQVSTADEKVDPDRENLERLYRFRVVESKRFSPQ